MRQIFKFQNLTKSVKFSKEQKEYIKSLSLSSGDIWKSTDDKMEDIKNEITKQLLKIQDSYCIYCGFTIDFYDFFEREHIALKSKYPEFMFEPLNLALACNTCNKSTRKGRRNLLIEPKNKNYKLNKFKIIHPHLDNRDDHIMFSTDGISLIAKNNSKKGKETIKIFKLNNPGYLTLRGQQYLINKHSLGEELEDMLNKILQQSHSVN